MSIKPQYETYRYTDEICKLKSQSIVECRLPGSEIGTVLAIQAKVAPTETTCADGEVHYGGKLLLCILYEDLDRKICRAERGAEFFHKAEGNLVTPACFAKALLHAENITYRREGSGLYVSAIVGATLNVYGVKQTEYLFGGDGLIVKNEPMEIVRTVCISGETEGEDEFETDYVGDILMHGENAVVTQATAVDGQIDIEGELILNVCALKDGDGVCSYERVIPFRMQIPCEEAFSKIRVGARVSVKSAQLTAGVDEDAGKSKIVFSYCLLADCFLHCIDGISATQDAFSTQSEIGLTLKNGQGRYLTNMQKSAERIIGSAAINAPTDGTYALACALLPEAEAHVRKTENGVDVEGAITAEVLLKSEDGGYKACTLTLPFVFPVYVSGDELEIDCAVCGLNVRRKPSGETEAEATLKICLRSYEHRAWRYVGEVEEGEAIEVPTAAISVFMPRAGEDLWSVAKRLKRAPEDVVESNPELTFPVRDGERIFVYRQIK